MLNGMYICMYMKYIMFINLYKEIFYQVGCCTIKIM